MNNLNRRYHKISGIAIGLMVGLTATSSFAQNLASPIKDESISSDVTLTVNYLDSIINTMGDDQKADRFQSDEKYSVVGPALQKRLKKRLEEFRSSLKTLIESDFGSNIKLYQAALTNTNISSQNQEQTLTGIYATLASQANNVSVSYQAQIKKLMAIEPSWIPTQIKFLGEREFGKHPQDAFELYFSDQSKSKLHLDYSPDLMSTIKTWGYYYSYYAFSNGKWEFSKIVDGYLRYPKVKFDCFENHLPNGTTEWIIPEGNVYKGITPIELEGILAQAVKAGVIQQIKNTIYGECGNSTFCKSNLFNDYANYLQQVKNMVNRDLPFNLGDTARNRIAIQVEKFPFGLNDSRNLNYEQLYEAIEEFDFNSDLNQ